MDANPDVSVSGSGNGSGKGLTAVAAGTVTIGNSDVFADTKLEADQVKNLVDHEVAVVGMGPVVSKNVTVDDLSLEQLKGIFSGQITNWKEVGGDDATIVVLNRKAGPAPAPPSRPPSLATRPSTLRATPSSTSPATSRLRWAAPITPSPTPTSRTSMTPSSTPSRSGRRTQEKNVTDDSFKIWATEQMYCSRTPTRPPRPSWSSALSDDVQGKLVEEQGFIPVSAMKVVKDASGKVSAK